MIFEPVVCLAQNHAPILCQDLYYLQTDRNEHPLEPRHLEVPSSVFKMISEAMVCWRKPCNYLAPILTLSLNGLKWDSTWPTSPRCSIGCVQNDFWACGMFSAKPCTYLALRIALSPNGPKRASSWASSRRTTIVCIQNDFWTYSMFGANRAPILHRY
jgi:hypothetical protein